MFQVYLFAPNIKLVHKMIRIFSPSDKLQVMYESTLRNPHLTKTTFKIISRKKVERDTREVGDLYFPFVD
jgi:hypothetical protein